MATKGFCSRIPLVFFLISDRDVGTRVSPIARMLVELRPTETLNPIRVHNIWIFHINTHHHHSHPSSNMFGGKKDTVMEECSGDTFFSSCPSSSSSVEAEELPTVVVDEIASKTTLAGRIWPAFRETINNLQTNHLQRLLKRFIQVFHYQDLLSIVILGWGLLPFLQSLYRVLYSRRTSRTTITPFHNTRLYVVVFYFCQAIQLSLLVYLFDLVLVVCFWEEILESEDDEKQQSVDSTNTNNDNDIIGVVITSPLDYSWLFAKILYTLWTARIITKFKHYLLVKFIGQKQNKDGLALLIDHLLNAMIGGVAAMIIIDILELSGLGIRSAFALGSAGTLAITLGTQTLVTHIVSGFTMTTSNRFYVGDLVQFGSDIGKSNKFMGTIVSLGWLETTIRGADELIHTVPNAKLEGIAVSNLSRHERCQVKQTLHFHFEDVHKLPALMKTIRQEIIDATSEHIITDGSRPCRVCWSGYGDRHLEVTVDVHFDGIKPVGDVYCANREKVLMAIQTAVDKHDMKLAVLQCGCCKSGGG